MNIPPQYKADGIWISKWLNEQRQIYIGNRPGKQLTEDQIRRLEAIGMAWENRNHQLWSQSWQEQFEEAKQFHLKNGHLRIPRDYRTANGKNLAVWLTRQRALRKKGKLPSAQVELLSSIGMEWELADSWENGFEHARQYYSEHGDLAVPNGYQCPDGFNLSSWLANQRSNYRKPSKYHSLLPEQAERLEAIGIVWNPSEQQWMEGFHHAEAYIKSLDGKPWKTNSVSSDDGYPTGQWIRSQMRTFQRGRMKADRKELFQRLGLVPSEQPKVAAKRKPAIYREEARYDV